MISSPPSPGKQFKLLSARRCSGVHLQLRTMFVCNISSETEPGSRTVTLLKSMLSLWVVNHHADCTTCVHAAHECSVWMLYRVCGCVYGPPRSSWLKVCALPKPLNSSLCCRAIIRYRRCPQETRNMNACKMELRAQTKGPSKIGRASCRERV